MADEKNVSPKSDASHSSPRTESAKSGEDLAESRKFEHHGDTSLEFHAPGSGHEHRITDDEVRAQADRARAGEPEPPKAPPSTDLYETTGGFQAVPKGIDPESLPGGGEAHFGDEHLQGHGDSRGSGQGEARGHHRPGHESGSSGSSSSSGSGGSK